MRPSLTVANASLLLANGGPEPASRHHHFDRESDQGGDRENDCGPEQNEQHDGYIPVAQCAEEQNEGGAAACRTRDRRQDDGDIEDERTPS